MLDIFHVHIISKVQDIIHFHMFLLYTGPDLGRIKAYVCCVIRRALCCVQPGRAGGGCVRPGAAQ
jgi:hypothetical protein